MANNVVMRQINVTTQWQPLSATSVIGTFTISAPPSNTANVLFRTKSEPAQEVTWVPSEFHTFTRIDLASIEVKSASGGGGGDKVTVNGGSG